MSQAEFLCIIKKLQQWRCEHISLQTTAYTQSDYVTKHSRQKLQETHNEYNKQRL